MAASVFQSSAPPNPDIPEVVKTSGYDGKKDTDVSTSDIEMQHKAKLEVCNLRSLCSLSICSSSSPHHLLPLFLLLFMAVFCSALIYLPYLLFFSTQDIKSKQSDRTKFGLRVSDGIGRLQVEASFLCDVYAFTVGIYFPLI